MTTRATGVVAAPPVADSVLASIEAAPPAQVIPKWGGASIRILKDLITVKVSAEDSAGAISFFETTFEAGGGPPLHAHAELEIFYVVEGEVDFTRVFEGGRETVTTGPGDTIWVPPWAPHTYHVRGARATAVFCAVPSGIERFFLEMGERVDPRDPPPSGDLIPDQATKLAHRETAYRHGHVHFL